MPSSGHAQFAACGLTAHAAALQHLAEAAIPPADPTLVRLSQRRDGGQVIEAFALATCGASEG